MFKKILVVLAIISAVFTCTLGRVPGTCPPAEAFAPCTCDDVQHRLQLKCDGGEGEFKEIDLQQVFDRVTPLIDQNTTFSELYLLYLGNREFPAHLTSLKFETIRMYDNRVEVIHPDAFNSSMDTTTEIYVAGNMFTSTNNSFFNWVNKFPNLESLTATEDNLLSIPDDPFVFMPNLSILTLSSCALRTVGSRVFANLPSLTRTILTYCTMPLDGFAADAFHGVGPNVTLDMEFMPIPHLPEDVFKPFLDGAKRLIVGGEWCFPSCFHFRLDCSKAAWVCENVELYRPRLSGYWCLQGTEGDAYQIWDWCEDNASH